eukprot:2049464-Alexandrium_andersonii.AAC.1
MPVACRLPVVQMRLVVDACSLLLVSTLGSTYTHWAVSTIVGSIGVDKAQSANECRTFFFDSDRLPSGAATMTGARHRQ